MTCISHSSVGQWIMKEVRSEAVIGKLCPDCLSAGQLDGCAGLYQIWTVLLHFSQITPLSSVIIGARMHTHTHTNSTTYLHNGLKFVIVDIETGVTLFRVIGVNLGLCVSIQKVVTVI